MKFRFIVFMLAALFTLQGCAYFNTYYNTKKLYKEALEENKRRRDEKPTSAEIQKYDKTIEKASKILQFHPGSKYVDDALLMIGECFFYKQEYVKALRKFDELTANYPKSELAPRAELWKARTHIERQDFAAAINVLKDFLDEKKKGEVVDHAQYYLAELYFRQKDYAQAEELYERSAKKVATEKLRAAAYMRLGECRNQLEQFAAAAKAFDQAAKQSAEIDFKFKANLATARALKEDKRYDLAARKLNHMGSEYSTHQDVAWVKYELALCALLKGEREEAATQLVSVNTNYKRSEASAAAYFTLGEIFRRYRFQYEKAKEHYDKVRGENARTEYAQRAQERSKAIDELLKLKNSLTVLELQRLSLQSGVSAAALAKANESEASGKKMKNRNTSIRRYPTKTLAVSNDPQKLANDIAGHKINLAELYYYQLDMPDSATWQYREVIAQFRETAAAPRAMYALAFLLSEQNLAQRDSLLQIVATEHAKTPHGAAARKQLGLPELTDDSAALTEDKFSRAEELWLAEKNPRAALRLYQEYLAGQTDAERSSKSLYAIGWLYEHELKDHEQAYQTYKQLLEKYPNSSYSKKLGKKVSAYAQKDKAAPQTTAAPTPAVAPSTDQAQQSLEQEEREARESLQRRIEEDRRKEVDEREKPPVKVEEELEEENDDEPPAEEEPPRFNF